MEKSIFMAQGYQSIWQTCEQDKFLEAMADAVKSVVEYRKNKIMFINVMKDMAIDCDCHYFPATPEFTLRQRMEDLHAIHILETGVELGIGTRKYELIKLK